MISSHLVDGDDVSKADAQIFAHDLVDSDPGLLHCVVCQDNAYSVLALLALYIDTRAVLEIWLAAWDQQYHKQCRVMEISKQVCRAMQYAQQHFRSQCDKPCCNTAVCRQATIF